jgi:hypothetical protein|tara:strand:+ start:1029 stop:2000 length:972 start_codon:yes stop_codon:yes gene_type:complete
MRLVKLILLGIIIASCDNNPNSYKPISSGNIHTVTVVMGNALWQSQVGDRVREVFATEFLGLPQQEPLFSLKQISPDIFSGFTRSSRNVLTVLKTKRDTLRITKNKYANPQVVVEIFGKNNKEIINQINLHATRAIKAFKKNEIEEKQRRIKKSILETDELKNLHIDLTLPSAYKVVKKEEASKLWLQRETEKGSVNVLVYFIENDNSFEEINKTKIIKLRDSISKIFVPGRNENSYMITEKAYKPYFFKTTIRGLKTLETRGTWEVKNDYMAGPFLNYIVKDKKNNRFIVMDGFAFSPSIQKRQYMVELEAIFRSLKVYNKN